MSPSLRVFFVVSLLFSSLLYLLVPVRAEQGMGVLHLSYVVEVYDPSTNRTGFFQFWSPLVLSGLDISKLPPGEAFLARHVVINVSIDASKRLVNFTVVIGPGVLAKVKYLRNVASGATAYTIARIVNVTRSGLYAVIKRSYRYDPATYTLFTLDGRWIGSTLYLARVDPSKPVFHLVYVDPTPSACTFAYSDAVKQFLTNLAHVAGFNLSFTVIEPGQTISIKAGRNIVETISAGRNKLLLVRECAEYTVDGVVIDPRVPAKPYSFGSVTVPSDEAVYFGSDLVRRNPGVVLEVARGVKRVGDGVAVATTNVTAGRDIDFFIAIRLDKLPRIVSEYVSRVLGLRAGGVIAYSPLIYASSVYSIHGEYHLSGYLLWAETSAFARVGCSVIAPSLDLSLAYCSRGGEVYFQLINASTMRTRLVYVGGGKGLPLLVAHSLWRDYLFRAVWLGVFLFSASALASAMLVSRRLPR